MKNQPELDLARKIAQECVEKIKFRFIGINESRAEIIENDILIAMRRLVVNLDSVLAAKNERQRVEIERLSEIRTKAFLELNKGLDKAHESLCMEAVKERGILRARVTTLEAKLNLNK